MFRPLFLCTLTLLCGDILGYTLIRPTRQVAAGANEASAIVTRHEVRLDRVYYAPLYVTNWLVESW